MALHTGEMSIEGILPPASHVIAAENNRQQQMTSAPTSAQTSALMHQLQVGRTA